MNYRKADMADIDTLTRLRIDMLCEDVDYSQAFRTHVFNHTKRFFTDGFHDDSCVAWLAEEDNEVVAVGCVNFFVLPPTDWCPDGHTAYIGNMYTIPPFRKQGIAARILEELISEAKGRGCERMLLNTTDMGRRIYEEHGFEHAPTFMALFPFGIIPDM